MLRLRGQRFISNNPPVTFRRPQARGPAPPRTPPPARALPRIANRRTSSRPTPGARATAPLGRPTTISGSSFGSSRPARLPCLSLHEHRRNTRRRRPISQTACVKPHPVIALSNLLRHRRLMCRERPIPGRARICGGGRPQPPRTRPRHLISPARSHRIRGNALSRGSQSESGSSSGKTSPMAKATC